MKKEKETMEKKEEKITTIAKAYRILGTKGFPSREKLAEAIVDELKKNGVTKTKKSIITSELVLRQIRNMNRDINQKKGLWKNTELKNEKDLYKLIITK